MFDDYEEDDPKEKKSKRKGQKQGRLYEVMKKLRLQSHEHGEFCYCKRLDCMNKINEEERKTVLKHFNALSSHDDQNAYLCGLMSINLIKRRRPRKNQEEDDSEAIKRICSFSYVVRVKKTDTFTEIPVCVKFFLAIHGIGRGKLQNLQKSMQLTGNAPKEKRGGFNYRELAEEIKERVRNHIDSFHCRQSHYSLKDNKEKWYLPEELSVKQMFKMFKEKYPNDKISYGSYYGIFKKEFNISFGYPRSDTCSICDEHKAKRKILMAGNQSAELKAAEVFWKLHICMADYFYTLKRRSRFRAKKNPTVAAITMDYAKNVYIPNMTTGDVYYRRQYTMLSFNIHVLSNGKSYFYTYPESTAKKGANEVISFLFHFILNFLPSSVKQLQIFCDAAGGQNKNYAIFRFIHYVVNVLKLLLSIQITYPVRGHSYLECDRNLSNINFKKLMELPEDWENNIRSTQEKPYPFEVVSVQQSDVKAWTEFLGSRYVKKCPFPIQKVKQVAVTNVHPRNILHRNTYNGPMLTHCIMMKDLPLPRSVISFYDFGHEFELPEQAYYEPIPISNEKYKDLVHLSKFCQSTASKRFYESLVHLPEGKKQKKTSNKSLVDLSEIKTPKKTRKISSVHISERSEAPKKTSKKLLLRQKKTKEKQSSKMLSKTESFK